MTAPTPTFYEQIQHHAADATPEGDLARDLAMDDEAVRTMTADELMAHLSHCNPCTGAWDAALRLYSLYEGKEYEEEEEDEEMEE